ncbi:MAG: AcrR family transcriptional regulator [Paracoccaceae bacterium]|jgi:AcrR family transcriptional regulator
MSHKKDQRFVQSERSIVAAGIDTLLKNPYSSLSDVALAAGVGRATMYRHFETRDALIKHIGRICMEDTVAALAPTDGLYGRQALESAFDALMPLANKYHFLINSWHIVVQDEVVSRIDAQQIGDLQELIDQAKKIGVINNQHPTEWVAACFDNLLIVAWSLVQEGKISSKDAAKYAKSTFFDGCGA